MDYSLVWTILFGLGIIQGIFICLVLLFLKHPFQNANRWLAALVWLFVLLIGEEFLEMIAWNSRFPHTIEITLTLDFLIGPIMYIYVRSITQAPKFHKLKYILLFLPWLISFLFWLPFYLLPASEKVGYWNQEPGLSFFIFLAFKFIVLYLYFFLTIAQLRSWLKMNHNENHSNHHYLNINWTNRVILFNMLAVLLIYILAFLPNLGIAVPIYSDHITSLTLTFSIYFIAFLYIKYPMVLFKPKGQNSKYRTSGLTKVQKEKMTQQLLNYIQEAQPYLNPDLKLDDLALALQISPNQLSQLINEVIGKNFYEFINDYRIQYFKKKISNPKENHRTLLSLALESGFKSKSSFNRIFKQSEGLTPSAFKKNLHPPS